MQSHTIKACLHEQIMCLNFPCRKFRYIQLHPWTCLNMCPSETNLLPVGAVQSRVAPALPCPPVAVRGSSRLLWVLAWAGRGHWGWSWSPQAGKELSWPPGSYHPACRDWDSSQTALPDMWKSGQVLMMWLAGSCLAAGTALPASHGLLLPRQFAPGQLIHVHFSTLVSCTNFFTCIYRY